MKLVLAKEAVVVEEGGTTVEYDLNGTRIYLITDETHNRMRFMSPVIEKDKLKNEDYQAILNANFDRALDAKYALYQDILWAVYTHPLKEHSQAQVVNAFHQVKALVQNYGSSYSSTDVVFGGN